MPFVSFEAPTTPVEPHEGERPLGRELAVALLSAVEANGYRIAEPLDQHDSYGWCFSVKLQDGPSVWCMLQRSDEWLLMTRTHQSVFQRLFGRAPAAAGPASLDALLVDTLSSTPHVSNVRWFRTEDDLRHGRAGHP